MKHFLQAGLAVIIVLGAAPETWADGLPFPFPFVTRSPRPLPPVKASVAIEINDKVTQPHLIIPQQIATQLQRGQGGSQHGVLSPNSTKMAGICLSLAAVACGIWLVRRKREIAKIPLVVFLMLVAVLGVGSLVGSFVLANNPPLPEYYPARVPPHVQEVNLASILLVSDNVQVSIMPGGDVIRYIINQETYQRLKNSNLLLDNPAPPKAAPGDEISPPAK